MKAISLWQPWATLIADQEKRWETRSRQIHYRGMIAICAAQKREPMILYRRMFPFRERLQANGYNENKDLPLGCIVAIGRVTDCITTTDWMRLYCKTPAKPEDDREYCFGNYEPGRFAWKIEDIRKLKEPLPIRGRQFIWTLSDAEEAEACRQALPDERCPECGSMPPGHRISCKAGNAKALAYQAKLRRRP